MLSVYNGERKIFETAPVKTTGAGNNPLKTASVKLEFSAAKIPPGKYDCQLTVLKPAQQKVAFWRSPIAIVP